MTAQQNSVAECAAADSPDDIGSISNDVDHISEDIEQSSEDIELIKNVYDKFVFAKDSQGEVAPESYFTDKALKKLQHDYEFDCDEDPCYAFYALRTGMQDSKPGTDGASQISNIEPDREGWYVISYSDLGWDGKTRVRIVDGKIDDYRRL